MNIAASARFERDGYVVIKQALPVAALAAAREQVLAFKHTNLAWLEANRLLIDGRLSRVVNLHLLLPGLRPLFTALPDDILAALGFACPSLYTSLYFERGSEQGPHRDTPYFWTSPPYAYAGLWAALEDVDERNGALMVIPGSHRLGEPDLVALRRSILGDTDCPASHTPLFDAYNAWVRRQAVAAGLEPVAVHVEKGDLILWKASTLHGGLPHLDAARSRHSFVMHVVSEGVAVNQMHYFFHPDRAVPERADWRYIGQRGRAFAAHSGVSFLHKMDCSLDQFDATYRFVGHADAGLAALPAPPVAG